MENLGNKKLEICSQGSKIAESTRISPHEVLQSWLINTVYHLLVKNNKGEERGGGLKEKRGLLTFFAWKEGGDLFERAGLIEDLP